LLLDFPLPFPLTQLKPEGLNLAQSRCRARLFPAGPLDARLLWRLRLPKDGRIVAQEGASAEFRTARLSVQRGGEGERAELDYRLSWEGSPIEPAEYSGYRSFLLAALDPSMTRFVVALE